jgi:hypothetical protein
MSQVYPSPTLYTYRVHSWGVVPGVTTNVVTVGGITQAVIGTAPVRFQPEYSANAGSTWNPATNASYQSLQEAYQAIANIVNNESSFATNFVANSSLLPGYTNYSYPV